MVIEPLSLIFFRVPSCAAAGTAMARTRTARIRVIGRVMSVSLWAFRAGGWVGGEAAGFYGSPPFLVQAAPAAAERQNAPGGLEFDLLSEKERDMSQAPTRIEHDLLGERAVACVKQAEALANNALGLLPDDKADAIARACEEIREGKLLDPFVVDVIQGGAGTSTNMNANEVIANRGLELLGHARGEYQYLHPVEDVNMSQSTNDVYPTAVKVALHFAIDRLGAAMQELRRAFSAKAQEFADVLKMGRTQLQDAVPMTLGQELSTYAVMLEEDEERLREAALLITEINLGATAIGTGINAHPDYAALVC